MKNRKKGPLIRSAVAAIAMLPLSLAYAWNYEYEINNVQAWVAYECQPEDVGCAGSVYFYWWGYYQDQQSGPAATVASTFCQTYPSSPTCANAQTSVNVLQQIIDWCYEMVC